MKDDVLIELGKVSEETKGKIGPENESVQHPELRN
jgi:hypothetical protein